MKKLLTECVILSELRKDSKIERMFSIFLIAFAAIANILVCILFFNLKESHNPWLLSGICSSFFAALSAVTWIVPAQKLKTLEKALSCQSFVVLNADVTQKYTKSIKDNTFYYLRLVSSEDKNMSVRVDQQCFNNAELGGSYWVIEIDCGSIYKKVRKAYPVDEFEPTLHCWERGSCENQC